MKIKKNFMIDGNVVEKYTSFCGIDVFVKEEVDGLIQYYVKGSDVVAVQRIGADCSQNSGFISEYDFEVLEK